MTIVNFADKDTHGLDAPTQEKQIMTREYFEEMLDAGKLQTATICGGRQNWYDVFRNGKTKTWKRTGRFEIPLRFLSSDSATRPSSHHTGQRNIVRQWCRLYLVQDQTIDPNGPEFNFGWRAQLAMHNASSTPTSLTASRQELRPASWSVEASGTAHDGHWRAGSVSRIETPPTAAGNVAGAGRPQ